MISARTVPRPLIADTSLLIPFFKGGTDGTALRRAIRSGRLYLSSLTALELYVGTRDIVEKRALDRFVDSFVRRRLVVAPRHEDYVLGGVLLARRRRSAGDLLAHDHVVDVLVVLSAAQISGTVLTANVQHLELWAVLARRTGADVRVERPTLE